MKNKLSKKEMRLFERMAPAMVERILRDNPQITDPDVKAPNRLFHDCIYYRRIIRAMAATALCEARAKVQAMTDKQVADETAWIIDAPGYDLRQALAIHLAERCVSNVLPGVIVRHIVEDHPKIDDDVIKIIFAEGGCRRPEDSAELGDLIDDLCYFCRCHWGSNYRRAHYVVDTDTGLTKTFFY